MGIAKRVIRPQATEVQTSQDLDTLLRRGSSAWAGMSVTAATAITISTVFGCVRVVSEDIGKLPAVLYEQNGDETRERATTSPYWRIAHDRPNTWMTSQAFRETLTAWALLRGNGFALKSPAGGQVRELLPLHPDRVRIEQLDDWEVIYLVRLADGVERRMTRREIFHLMGLSLDGIQGIGVVSLARQTFGTALATQRHAAKFFANGLQTSGVFTHPASLSDQAYSRLTESLKEDHTGDGAYNAMLLEEGMSWAQTGLTNEDSQFLQSRAFDVVEMCRWFRVNPHKVQDFSRAHFNNIEASNLDHVTDTLMPWAKRWEFAWNQQVIGSTTVFYELLFDALLRGTTKERYEAYQMAAGGNAPWMNRNEIRKLENKPPIPGLDEMLTPMNMNGATEDTNAPDPEPDLTTTEDDEGNRRSPARST